LVPALPGQVVKGEAVGFCTRRAAVINLRAAGGKESQYIFARSWSALERSLARQKMSFLIPAPRYPRGLDLVKFAR
jgi:hypothetical protein